jgi:uncharacterized protein YprB with RNaseH-like and TPR domain
MIERTFQILPSIGERRERTLWGDGITDWRAFLDADRVRGVSKERKADLDTRLDRAYDSLDAGRTGYFRSLLPSNEHWRMYGRFARHAAYLDIETDGLHRDCTVTVVSVHCRGETTTLINGEDLDSETLASALEGVPMLVTFNGSCFDLPILEHQYPFSVPRVPHFDLRFGARRIGLTGGLKGIERKLGMRRDQEVEFVTGEEAVHLWHLWKRKGRRSALKLLCRYNAMDTENLEPVAAHVYRELERRTLGGKA